MEPTAAGELGHQFAEFLLQQFGPGPGSRHTLGFLGTGVAVRPDSFLSEGQFNPARVNSWLGINADPLCSIPREGGRVASTGWTAISLMQAIAATARCTSPADSEEQQVFAKAKSDLMLALGGAGPIDTAPLDWYDPAQLGTWPTCKLKVGSELASGSSSGSGSEPPPPAPAPAAAPGRRALWAWRKLDELAVARATEPAPAPAPPEPAPATVEPAAPIAGHTMLSPAVLAALRPRAAAGGATAMAAAPMTMRAAAQPAFASPVATHVPGAALGAVKFMRASAELKAQPNTALLAVGDLPSAVISETASAEVTAINAALVSTAISTAADEASTTSVASTSFSMSLSYLVVMLSRASWWSEFMLLLDNWYIPGMKRASIIREADAEWVSGIPVALILTSDVRIAANWSESDRSMVSSSTHFGPWAVHATRFEESAAAGEAILSIPDMQAIACVYRDLPVVPPRHDPDVETAVPPG